MQGDKNAADQAAVDMMRKVLSTVQMNGIVVIGEGEKDVRVPALPLPYMPSPCHASKEAGTPSRFMPCTTQCQMTDIAGTEHSLSVWATLSTLPTSLCQA